MALKREVTATVVEIGDIPVLNGDESHTYERAALIQFDSVEDLKLAIAATRMVRLEWPQSR